MSAKNREKFPKGRKALVLATRRFMRKEPVNG